MALWEAAGKQKDVTEADSVIRRYTETVMQMLQEAHEGGQDLSDGMDHLGMKGKYSGSGDAYWDTQYEAPNAMQEHGFCKATSPKYGSRGSERTLKPAEDTLVPLAAHSSYDAPNSTSAEDLTKDADHRVKWTDVFVGNVGSRYLDEGEAAEKGERIPVLDSRAAVERTVLEDIAAKRTLRKLSTLTALLERQKRGVHAQDNLRLPRVAMMTLKARKRLDIPRERPPAIPCVFPEGCDRC